MKDSKQRSAVSGQRRIVFVTGSDTGVGKTVVTALLTRRLRAEGVSAVSLKPLCSGGREDAVMLHAANGGVLTIAEVNPWHFRAALAPVLAAQREGRGVKLGEVVAHARAVARRFELVLLEGAGGLLSPLGEGFDSRDLIVALSAVPIVVVPNRLGGVNQALLVLEALPKAVRSRAMLVIVDQPTVDRAARSNVELLSESVPGMHVTRLPWVGDVNAMGGAKRNRRVAAALKLLVAALCD